MADASGRVEVPIDAFRSTGQSILLALGATDATARAQMDVLLEGDLRGHASHGLQRLPTIVDRIRAGLADPVTTGRHTWVSETALRVDGERGLGPPVGFTAVDAIAARAATHGVALAVVRDANHLGMVAPYVERLAGHGLVGLGLTTSEALVHAWGGRAPIVGTNPIALAVPTSKDPVVVDMATGAISRGKVLDHASRDVPLGAGAAVDVNGEPTTDPHAALDGAISPFGGAKGYALAVGLELLVASLTGTALGTDVRGTLDTTEVSSKGDVFLAASPRMLTGSDHLDAIDDYVDALRESVPRDPSEPVAVPGDRARATRTARLEAGTVEVSTSAWTTVQGLAAAFASDDPPA